MLLSFNFSNFHSFADEIEFTMSAGTTRRHPSHIAEVNGVSVLKYSAIYGANAAGKSSLIKAFKGSRNMVRGEPVANYADEYCRSISDNKAKPSSFEYFFEHKGRFFQYGFESVLFTREFSSEWLYEVTPDMQKEILIYSVEKKDGEIIPNWAYFLDNEAEVTRLNQIRRDSETYSGADGDEDDEEEEDNTEHYSTLFISKMRGKKFEDLPRLEILRDIYKWFSNKLRVDYLPSPTSDEDIAMACRYMSRYDTDLSGGEYRFERDITDNLSGDSKKNMKEGKPMVFDDGSKIILENGRVNLYTIHTRHSTSESDFGIREESNGTRRGLNLVHALFGSKDDDVTFILDEFGLAMHPLLVSTIFKDYQEHNVNRSNQLILATHHTRIMDFTHFRRDEFWFIDKENGVSRIYSLEDFSERPDAEVYKRYLEGRYGALPVFTELESEEVASE